MRRVRLIFLLLPIVFSIVGIVRCQQIDHGLLKEAHQIAGTTPKELSWEISEILGSVPVEIYRMTASDLVSLFDRVDASSPPGKRTIEEVSGLFNLSISIRGKNPADFCYSVRVFKSDLKGLWLDRVPDNKKCGKQRFGYINRKLFFNIDKWADTE